MPLETPPVDASLFASLDPPRLAGARCDDCGTVVFPSAGSCPRCSGRAMSPYALPERGSLWSWTVQSFAPRPPYVPAPDGFAPFAVGYVDLGEVIVEGHLLAEPDELRIGMAVRLVLHPVGAGDVVGYAYVPDGEGSG